MKFVRMLRRLAINLCVSLTYFHAQVLVEVEDINDNSPKFPKDFLDISVPESLAPGQLSLLIDPASDPDSPRNGINNYHLEPAEDKHSQPFYLVSSRELSGGVDLRLELRYPIDRERKAYYRLKVIATDGGNVCRSGSVVVGVSIEDINDNSPRFVNATYEAEITENAPPRDDLVVVRATDPDFGNNGKVVYSLSDDSRTRYGSLFAVDADTGVVSQLLAIDFEEHNGPIHLEVIARDAAAAAGGIGVGSSTSGTALVVVSVRDENDNVPNIQIEVETENEDGFSSKRYNGKPVDLRIKEHGPVDKVLAALSVEDADSGNAGRVHCSMPSTHFYLKPFYDNEYQVRTGPGVLDREIQDRYRLVITCNDMGQPVRSSSAIIYVIVDDVNDNDPQFSETIYSWTVVENQSIGDVIGRVTATDQDVVSLPLYLLFCLLTVYTITAFDMRVLYEGSACNKCTII